MSDYHINVFYSEEDGGYIADIPDLEACSAFGASPEEALAEVEKAKEAWLAAARDGASLPARDLRAIGRAVPSGGDNPTTSSSHARPNVPDATACARRVPPPVPPHTARKSDLQGGSSPGRPILTAQRCQVEGPRWTIISYRLILPASRKTAQQESSRANAWQGAISRSSGGTPSRSCARSSTPMWFSS